MRTDGTTTLDHYLKPIVEHRKLILAVTATMTMLALVASALIPPSYRSTASVLLTPISGNPLTPLESDTEVDMATELLIATSKTVVARVAEDLAGQSMEIDTEELGDNVAASSPRDSKVLDLAYEASTPELAQVVANAFAGNYLEYREQIATENRAEAVDGLNERVASLKQQLSQIEGELAQLEPGTQRFVSVSVERDSIDGELRAQQEALAALSTLSPNAGEILSPAKLPLAGAGPGTVGLLTGGLAAGLVIGIALAMLISAVEAGRAPRNRRAADKVEHNRRQDDRLHGGGRRAADRQSESAVERLARVTAGRRQGDGQIADAQVPVEAAEEGRIDGDDTRLDEEADETVETGEREPDPAGMDPAGADVVASDAIYWSPVPAAAPVTGDNLPPRPTPVAVSEPPTESTTTPEPQPAQPVGITETDQVAAHFGTDVPPPPRNKAKLNSIPATASETVGHVPEGVDRRRTPSSSPEVLTEADFSRLAREIEQELAHRPLTFATVGEDHRTQSVAVAFALVDSINKLDVDILIVDAIADEPALAGILGLPESPGLRDLIAGRATLENAVQKIEGFNQISVLTMGRPTGGDRSEFGATGVDQILRSAKNRFAVTVVVAGDLTDMGRLKSSVGGELDGLVAATTSSIGAGFDEALANRISDLTVPVWMRAAILDDPDPSSTAAATATTV